MHVEQLEDWIAEFEAQVEMPREFVVPGDSRPGAALHLARTVVRRAERRAVRLAHEGLLANGQVLRYLNRLSSLLFVLACFEDQACQLDQRANPGHRRTDLLGTGQRRQGRAGS